MNSGSDHGEGGASLPASARLRLNTPIVASQVIDGEAVLINFETGSYYSAGSAGAEVLNLLERGLSVEDVLRDLADRYSAPGDVERDVRRFVGRLLEEGLVTPEPPPDGVSAAPPPPGDRPVIEEAPELQKFTDLEDLLLLDPIHDADEAGWPAARPDLDPPEG